jgi:hypothetical protein
MGFVQPSESHFLFANFFEKFIKLRGSLGVWPGRLTATLQSNRSQSLLAHVSVAVYASPRAIEVS